MIGFFSQLVDYGIGVEFMKKRKKPCLVIDYGYRTGKVASFDSPASARIFMDCLADFLGVDRIDWYGDNVPWGLNIDLDKEEDDGN